jgi:hypothetical protein
MLFLQYNPATWEEDTPNRKISELITTQMTPRSLQYDNTPQVMNFRGRLHPGIESDEIFFVKKKS